MASERSSACLEHETLAALIAGELLLDQHPQIEAHLAECSICQSILAAAAAGLEETEGPLWCKPGSFPKLGDVLAAKYRLEKVLGRGGMGTVFAATHGELGQTVAIKVLHSAAPSAAARFLREAQISAQLRSEHIVRVFDLGSTPDGAPFLVMEYLAGEDLSRVIARGPVSPTLALEYALQVCVALSEAHAAGVVHRDLKPANVFVSHRSDGTPCLKVLDFGISKRLMLGEAEQSHSLTQPHSVLGSPAYMSPEQLRASKDVNAQSDVWSLGIVLYELLTATRPFQAQSLSGLSAAIAADAPRPPSSVNASVPAAMDGVVMRCLRKDPKERFASAAEIERALRASLSSKRSSRRALAVLVGVLTAAAAILHLIAPGTPQVSVLATALQPLPESSPPRLSVHCDTPHPPGGLRFYSPSAATGPELDRLWPLTELCAAAEPDLAQVELARALALPLSRAALVPPHPFYQAEVQSDGGEVRVNVEKADRCAVELTLAVAGCASIESIEISASGLPMLSAKTAPAEAVKGGASCRRRVELPFSAFGKKLSFRFRPSRYSAPDVVFTSDALLLAIERRPQPRPSLARPKPCVPPEYCRN